MTTRFIFQKDIEQAIREGKKEIVLPVGSRISSAALDLINEKNIEVKFVEKEDLATNSLQDTANSAEHNARSEQGNITEEEIEEIVSRVIQRFRELKSEEKSGRPETEETDQEDDNLIICRCEEITKGEIKEAIRSGIKTLNGIKRITRAGMGLCQGQTCERLVSQILAEELGVSRKDVEPTTARAPVRPVPISVFGTG
jgi:bacterioferritin-associated ferredoxin